MPQFNPGEEKVALATFPVKPAGLECTGELWLASDTTPVATSGEIPFVATGLDQSIALPITMPGVEGTYPVNLSVSSGGVFIKGFLADEDVVIAAVGPPLASCVWCGAQFTTESELVAHMNANHPGKPYVVWAYLPQVDVVLKPGADFLIKAKVYAPSPGAGKRWLFAFKAPSGGIATMIAVSGAGFLTGEASSYHCIVKLGRWYCPPLGENVVYSDCYLHTIGYRWNENPIWRSVDIGLRVNFIK